MEAAFCIKPDPQVVKTDCLTVMNRPTSSSRIIGQVTARPRSVRHARTVSGLGAL